MLKLQKHSFSNFIPFLVCSWLDFIMYQTLPLIEPVHLHFFVTFVCPPLTFTAHQNLFATIYILARRQFFSQVVFNTLLYFFWHRFSCNFFLRHTPVILPGTRRLTPNHFCSLGWFSIVFEVSFVFPMCITVFLILAFPTILAFDFNGVAL